MKKVLTAALALLCSSVAFADPVFRSSYTATNDTALLRDEVTTNTIAHILQAVIVSSVSPSGNLKIYSSTYTTSNLKANISLGTLGTYTFGGLQLQGIYYVITSNTAGGVTIIYRD